MKKSGVRGVVAAAIVCVVAAALPDGRGRGDQREVLVDSGRHRRYVHEQDGSVEADRLDHPGRHGEGGRQGRGPARRLRQRHHRQQGSRALAGGRAGDAGHEVAPGLDGDPDAHDHRAAAAGTGQAQPRRHALEVVPRLPQRRQGHVADDVERHVGLPRLHPGEPAVPGRAARGAVPPLDRRRAAAVRVRAAGRLRPGRVLPLRAHQLHPARQRDREDHREVGDRADPDRSSSTRSG